MYLRVVYQHLVTGCVHMSSCGSRKQGHTLQCLKSKQEPIPTINLFKLPRNIAPREWCSPTGARQRMAFSPELPRATRKLPKPGQFLLFYSFFRLATPQVDQISQWKVLFCSTCGRRMSGKWTIANMNYNMTKNLEIDLRRLQVGKMKNDKYQI